jgi:signal transduction histidine kinase/ActR/RegA family two-component response regulator
MTPPPQRPDASPTSAWVAAFAALVLLAAVWSGLVVWSIAAETEGVALALHEARMAVVREGSAGEERSVALPDTWAHHRQGTHGVARYRASFELAGPTATVWALRIDRLGTHADVRINGTLVHGTLDAPPSALRRPVPALIALPAGLLHSGANAVEIVVNHGARGGLSPLLFGPMRELEAGFVNGYHREVGLPQWLNVLSIGACLVGLLVWASRRSEVALGSFATLGLLASARNVSYFAVTLPLPPPLTDWLFFATQIASAMLIGIFAIAVSGRPHPRLRAAWMGVGTAMAALGAVAIAGGWIQQARAWIYPVLLAGLLGAVPLVWPALRRLHATACVPLGVGIASVFGAGVHDYLYQQGRTSVMDAYWMPYAVPLAVLAFTAMLVHRVVGALSAVEHANLALEQRVRERTVELEEANAAKGRFLAAASHDLRQPVAGIGLLVGLLREQEQEPRQRALVDRIDQGVAALEKLLRGLLDVSRLDAGTVQPRIGRVELQAVFDAIAAHAGATAEAKGLRLRCRPTALAVVTDALLLEQMLRNLVDNAVRCTVHGSVLVAARRRGDRVLVQVRDSGCGMTADQQRNAFVEFVQFDHSGADGRVRGLGLGLAIVQRSARLLRHPLTLRSAPGRGSCFGIELPLDRRSAARGAVAVAADAAPQPLAGRQLVVVEDEPAVRDALVLRLQSWGAEVRAYAGLQALRGAAELGSPDLLLTDLRLPDGDGLAVIDALRARLDRFVPALVVTGSTLPAELARLQRAGVPVLNKPFRAESLLAALAAALAAAAPAGLLLPLAGEGGG